MPGHGMPGMSVCNISTVHPPTTDTTPTTDPPPDNSHDAYVSILFHPPTAAWHDAHSTYLFTHPLPTRMMDTYLLFTPYRLACVLLP